MALVSHCHLQDQKALSSANWIFRARQNYNVTFSVWGSEPSNPADGSVPPEPSDSLATSMFWVNFFGLFYEQNSGNCFADFWWIFDARQNYNVTFSLWVSEPSYPVLWVLCKSMNFDPDKQLLQVACDRIEPLTLGQGQHSTPTSQGTH